MWGIIGKLNKYFDWVNEFNPWIHWIDECIEPLFQNLKSLKKPKRFGFLKVNNLFLLFRSLYKERLTLSFGVKFLNFGVKIIKPSFLSSIVIEPNTVQFIGNGYKVLLLSLENCFILGDRCLVILKVPVEKMNLF